MRGLTILLAGTDPDRLRSALGIAATQAALGGRVRLFADGPAAASFVLPLDAPGDSAQAAAGLPRLAELVETCLDLGSAIILCQSGLAHSGIAADRLDPRMAVGGLTSVLADLGEDRLLAL